MGQLLFKKCFFDAIRAGTKRTTIRRWSHARLKPGERAYTPGVGWLIIEAVEVVVLSRLKDADALADGFDSIAEMRRMLRRLYPAAAANLDGRKWFRVRFHRDGKVNSASPRKRRPRRSPVSQTNDVGAQRRALAAALRHAPKLKMNRPIAAPVPR